MLVRSAYHINVQHDTYELAEHALDRAEKRIPKDEAVAGIVEALDNGKFVAILETTNNAQLAASLPHVVKVCTAATATRSKPLVERAVAKKAGREG
jgi:hypothetical protein